MDRFLIYNFSGDIDEVSHLFPSERLARIAAIIRGHGKDVTVLDRANVDDVLRTGGAVLKNLGELSFNDSNELHEQSLNREMEQIGAEPYDCVFVNLWHGTGFKFSVDLMRRLKAARPEIRVYGIGQKVDWFTEHILSIDRVNCDGLITGLGYKAVDALVRGVSVDRIPNLIFTSPGGAVVKTRKEGVDVDDYPPPLYDEDVYRNVAWKAPIYSITLSNQACPNQCVFCIRPENYGRRVKRRRVEHVIREITDLHDRLGVSHFRVEDSTPPQGALTDLAGGILQAGLQGRVWFSGFARIDMNGAEDFDLLKAAGFISLFFGLESLDDGSLLKLRKGISYGAIGETLAKAHAAGIRTVGSFIFPLPGETRQTMETTLGRILELKPLLDSVVVLPAGVQPPTEWGRHPERFGIRLADNYIEESLIYPIKYLVPLRHWKPLPLSYDLMGRPAEQVTFADVVAVQEEFVGRLRKDYRIPGIPDYYFLIAHLLQKEPEPVLKDIVGLMMARDYDGLKRLFFRPDTADGRRSA